MSLRKGGAPETLAVALTIKGQGSTDKLNIVYHNRKRTEYEAQMALPEMTFGGVIPYLVKEWDTDFPITEEGVKQFEDEYPGIIQIILAGYGQARLKELEKN